MALYFFLTSKVRLHCDLSTASMMSGSTVELFPDLKGQAPLRPDPRLREWRWW